jgi:membrane-bound acyltransferase YfiQ involved in biofilm formation
MKINKMPSGFSKYRIILKNMILLIGTVDYTVAKGEHFLYEKEVFEVYWLRCICCIAVVIIHSISAAMGTFEGVKNTLITSYIPFLFATPAFVFISEFLIAKSYPNGLPNGFMKKRLKKLVPPYLFLAFIYAIFKTHQFSFLTFKVTLSNIFLGGFVAYFIIVIIQFYLLHKFFHKYLKNWSPKIVLPIGFVINILYLAFFNFSNPLPIPKADYIWRMGYWMPFVGWLFYFLLGYYCGRYYTELKIAINKYKTLIYTLSIVTLFIGFLVNHFQLYTIDSKRIDNILYTTCIILLVFQLTSKVQSVPNFVMLISRYSFNIYLLHEVFMMSVQYVPFVKDMNILVYIISLSILAIGGSIFISTVLNKFSFGGYLVGQPYAKQQKVQKKHIAA